LHIRIKVCDYLWELAGFNIVLHKQTSFLVIGSADTINYNFKEQTDGVVAAGKQIINIKAEGEVIADLVSTSLNHSALTTHEAHSF
jgi:hypothetical protein